MSGAWIVTWVLGLLAAAALVGVMTACSDESTPHVDPIGRRLTRPGQSWSSWESLKSGRFAQEVDLPLQADVIDLGAGGRLEFEAGRLHGVLRLGWYADVSLQIDSLGAIAVQMDFIDRSGQGWRHSSVVPCEVFRPDPTIALPLTPRELTSVYFGTSLDRDFQRFTTLVDLGAGESEVITGQNGYGRILPREPSDTLLMQVSMFSQHPRAVRGQLNMTARVPVAPLLWRRAPLVEMQRLEIESLEHVHLRRLDVPPQGIERSSVRVTPPDAAAVGRDFLAHLQLDGNPPAPRDVPDRADDPPTPGDWLVKRVSIPIDEERTIAYGAPPAVAFSKGKLVGDLRIRRLHGLTGEEQDQRILITFDFVDDAGRGWRHVAATHPIFFWPDEPVEIASRPKATDFAMQGLLDGRDEAYFEVQGGERINVQLKYFSFDFALTPGDPPDAVRVHATLCPVLHPISEDTLLGVAYHVPVWNLLWRRATGLHENDGDNEGGNFIDLRPLAAPPQGLPRSPVRVIADTVVEPVNIGAHDPKRRLAPGTIVHLKENAHLRYPNRMMEARSEFVTSRGRRVTVGPGRIIGKLIMMNANQPRPVSVQDENGWVQITFIFAARDGHMYAYDAVLTPEQLWPTGPVSLASDARDDSYYTTARHVHAGASLAPLTLTTGEQLGQPEAGEVIQMELKHTLGGARVRLMIGKIPPKTGRVEPRLSVEYDLPLEALLWRRGYGGDRLHPVPGAATGVLLRYLGHISRPGVEEDFVESAIDVPLPDPVQSPQDNL